MAPRTVGESVLAVFSRQACSKLDPQHTSHSVVSWNVTGPVSLAHFRVAVPKNHPILYSVPRAPS